MSAAVFAILSSCCRLTNADAKVEPGVDDTLQVQEDREREGNDAKTFGSQAPRDHERCREGDQTCRSFAHPQTDETPDD